tara:strand:+ start:537 stop:1040 length:504 start_codon:yes stop_codon:yes gene_type:complete
MKATKKILFKLRKVLKSYFFKEIKYLVLAFLFLLNMSACSLLEKKPIQIDEIEEVEEFSSSLTTLLVDRQFLKNEILHIHAGTPSIQRIISESDIFWKEGKLKRASTTLERALRISKNEGSVYLRLAHIRMEEKKPDESRAFASRGLLIDDLSSWERVLMNIYLNAE